MRAPTPEDFIDAEGRPRADLTPRAPQRTRTAAGTLPPNRRRNTADDVIESGEIETDRRSLVIRSQKLPAVDWNEGPTELSVPALVAVPRKRNWRMLLLAGAIVLGIAAVALVLRAKPDGTAVNALEARAEMIGSTLDGEARAVLVRAEAMATSPMLRAAVETDASTLANMARD